MSYDDIRTVTVTIALNESLSGAAGPLNDVGRLVGVITPSGWDAAKVSFQASVDGSAYPVLFDRTTATEYSSAAAITGAAYWPVDFMNFLGVRYLKIQSGTSGAGAVAQTSAVDVVLVYWKG